MPGLTPAPMPRLMRVLIAGCGDVGSVLASRLVRDGYTVYGLKRDVSTLPAGVIAVSADLTDPATLKGLPSGIDGLVFMPTPAQRTAEAYQAIYLQGWINLWAALDKPPRRSLIVSSTSVYAQSDGEWVDESSASIPASFNGRLLLEMETRARAASKDTIIARLSGIYGPGRERLVDLAVSGQAVQDSPLLYTNRIYRDDAAAALAHLLALHKPADLYLVTDDLPVAKYEVICWLAEQMGYPPPESSRGQGADTNTMSGKRISNQRLRDSGLHLKFPDYQAGYTHILRHRNNNEVSG